jgi:uncharacterized protein YbjT (DUF2867 family)
MILVTGAGGTVGREVVSLLLAAGKKVRAMTRNPGKARFDARVEVVAGDFEKTESLASATQGAERVFSLSTGPNLAAHEGALASAAKKAGVGHIVSLSVLGAGGGARSGVAAWHVDSEKAIQDSGVPWTFVRPGPFMSNALQWAQSVKSQGKVFSNYGDGKFPPIHPRDIAAVAVQALTQPGHAGKAYGITGSQAMGVGDMVRVLSEALGKPIQFVSIPDEAAREGMIKAGLPPVMVDALLPFGGYIRSGKAAEVQPTLEQVTGRPALTFIEWARENAAAFR